MTITSLWKNFSCAGGACQNTCCAGWNIPVSNEDIQHFSSLAKNDYQSILKNIDTENGFMRLHDGRCPFLTDENLCQIILDHGEDYPGETCRLFPRQINYFGEHIECSVRASCPHVVLELLEKKRIMVLYNTSCATKKITEDDKADINNYLPYLKLRDFLIASFQAADGYMAGKIWLLLQLSSDVEEMISNENLASATADNLINDYANQYKNILNECEKVTRNSSRVIDTIIYYYKRFCGAINKNKAEKYTPDLFSDFKYWEQNRSDFEAVLNELYEIIHNDYPLFFENYFINEIFLNWNASDNNFFLENLYSAIVRCMLFFFLMLSALFHNKSIEKDWLSKMVSDIDRDFSHNQETRHQIGKSLADSCNNTYCVPWIFPF